VETFTFRLLPGQDLFEEIERFVTEHSITAGIPLACVGSLTIATLRLANKETFDRYDGHFEIVSLTGTVSTRGSHLHISISDGTGRTIGGHLVEGCKIYTTAEIVIASFPELIYKREDCPHSGYPELVVYRKEEKKDN